MASALQEAGHRLLAAPSLPAPEAAAELAERLPAAAELALVDGSGDLPAVERTVEALDRRRPSLAVVVYGLASARQVVRVVEAGAEGYSLAGDSLAALEVALDGAVRRRPVCSLEVAELLVRRIGELAPRQGDGGSARPAPSGRELEVLRLLDRRLPNKEISRRLGISTATVKSHVHSLLVRLAARDRRQAVEKARAYGLLEPAAAKDLDPI